MSTLAPSLSSPRAIPAARVEPHWGAALPARLATFGALFLFAAAHWFALVQHPPVGRLLATGAAVIGGAAAIELSGRIPMPRGVGAALRLLLALATLELALLAAGLDPKYLLPQNWGVLGDGIDRGLTGSVSVDWPYSGEDEWIRTTMLLLPALIGAICAAVAFWPGEWLSRPGRITALAGLVGLFAAACAEYGYNAQFGRGLVLLALIAAFIWLPRLRGRQAAIGAAAMAAAGLLVLPLAHGLDRRDALLDYTHWNLFSDSAGTVIDWRHDYGPIDWPRTGATMLYVRSDEAHYWKAETLDRFDGLRWTRSGSADGATPGAAELPPVGNPKWLVKARVTVSKLRSDVLISPGHFIQSPDAGAVAESADGTTRLLGDVLGKGDSYEVSGYAPDPTAGQMRAATGAYPLDAVHYTSIELGGTAPLAVPLRGQAGTGAAGAAAQIEASPYRRTYALSRRLISDQPTTYDAVRNVESWLRSRLRYSESPPRRQVPLEGFLFQDKAGYCQQFSGAMALMLRMNGIPARVATGFSPGSFDSDSGEYRVRDLDAHSWVEAYFTGIGWVPFDPTPSIAPAESQASGSSAALGDLRDSAGSAARARDRGSRDIAPSGEFARRNRRGGSDWPVILAALGVAVLAGLALWLRAAILERRRLKRGVEGELRWLEALLRRAGSPPPPGATLLAIERRLSAPAPAAARYAGVLRVGRYSSSPAAIPARSERRAASRQVMGRAGWRRRLRAIFSRR